MSKLANQWIEIFRAGDYGQQGSFSEADLDRVVANYEPQKGHEAPIVVGHPKDNAPAFGWVGALKRVGQSLFAMPSQVDPAFAEMVNEGKFKKRSASFYRTPDGTSIQGLRHVGFLGAMPPVVKGLADCKFADQSESVFFEFQEMDMADVNDQSIVDKIIAGVRDALRGKKDEQAASFSEDDARRIATAAVAEAVKPLQTQLAATETRLAASEAKFSERESKLATGETTQRAAAAIEKVKAAGRWVPAFDKMGVALLFSELAKSTDTVEFGEGDGKKKLTPLELLAEFMESLPKIVPGGAVFDGRKPGESSAAAKGVNQGRMRVDANSVRLNEAALEFAEKEKVDYATAVTKVLAKDPTLGQPGDAAAGSV